MIPRYRTEPYLSILDTVIDAVAVEGGYQLVTCREALFAEGGGQPPDHGTLSSCGVTRTVLGLVKHKGDIRLRIEPIPELAAGEGVRCVLDFDRRYRIMRLHTGQHAWAGILRQLLEGYGTRGMRIDDDARICTMRFTAACLGRGEVPEGDFEKAKESFRGLVHRGARVFAEQVDSIALAKERYGPIFREGDPAVQIRGRVRMVVIEGLDANACGGTHLRDASEIGEVASAVMRIEHSEGETVAELAFTLDERASMASTEESRTAVAGMRG